MYRRGDPHSYDILSAFIVSVQPIPAYNCVWDIPAPQQGLSPCPCTTSASTLIQNSISELEYIADVERNGGEGDVSASSGDGSWSLDDEPACSKTTGAQTGAQSYPNYDGSTSDSARAGDDRDEWKQVWNRGRNLQS